MNISATTVPDAKASEAMKPAQGAVDHPAPSAQMFLGRNATPGDAWGDSPQAQPLPVAAIVVAFVGVQLGGPLSGSAGQARYFRQRTHYGLQQSRVMDVSRSQLRRQGQAALVDDEVMLAT